MRKTASSIALINIATTFWFLCCDCGAAIVSKEQGSLNENDDFISTSSSSLTIIGATVSVVVVLLVLVLVIPGCMDCMNSEVSSENHPACQGGSAHKWGGAVNYTPADRNNPGAGFITGEIINPADHHNQPLPYSMVPVQVPQEAGFQGYSSSVSGERGGMGGYQTSDMRRGSQGAGDRNRHFNPMEEDEPPPSYHESGY